jgi:hypothetical protein
MATLYKITSQEFQQIKEILSKYASMKFQISKKQKQQLTNLITKCQNVKKHQSLILPLISESEMRRITAIIDLWPTVSLESNALSNSKNLSTKLQRSFYKEYNTKALHS